MKEQQLEGAPLYLSGPDSHGPAGQCSSRQQGDPPARCSAGPQPLQPPSSSLERALIMFLRPCSPLENPLFLSFLQGYCIAVEKSMALLGRGGGICEFFNSFLTTLLYDLDLTLLLFPYLQNGYSIKEVKVLCKVKGFKPPLGRGVGGNVSTHPFWVHPDACRQLLPRRRGSSRE